MKITVAHSPDADDAFMFYALAAKKVGHPDIEYVHLLKDIQTLNEWALEGRHEVTAMSVHAYAYVADRYAILRSGASMGESHYGPMVVATTPLTLDQLKKTTIAIPGKMTSAYLLLQLALPGVETIAMPFDAIQPAVTAGKVAAGLLIHEGQLTFEKTGLHNVFPLYAWWHETYQLPMPLGVNGIRKDLPPAIATQVAADLRASIEYALAHRSEAVAHAKQFARDLPTALIDQFVGMYVNQRTVHMGDTEERAITALLRDAVAQRLIPAAPPVVWVG